MIADSIWNSVFFLAGILGGCVAARRISPVAADTAREALVATGLRLVRTTARSILRRGARVWVTESDLVSAGHEALADVLRRYKPQRGGDFYGFARERIRGAMLDVLRKNDVVDKETRSAIRRLGETTHILEGELGRGPTRAEIAARLGCDESRVEKLCLFAKRRVVSINEMLPGLPGGDTLDPGRMVRAKEIGRSVAQAISSLPPRERDVVCHRLRGLTQEEIGRILGVTESRICQILGEAVRKLKATLADVRLGNATLTEVADSGALTALRARPKI